MGITTTDSIDISGCGNNLDNSQALRSTYRVGKQLYESRCTSEDHRQHGCHAPDYTPLGNTRYFPLQFKPGTPSAGLVNGTDCPWIGWNNSKHILYTSYDSGMESQ